MSFSILSYKRKVVRDAELGKRFADKLVKVWKISGDELWVFTHIEIQQSRETKRQRSQAAGNSSIIRYQATRSVSPHEWRI